MITRKLNKETDFKQFAEISSSAYIHDATETTFNENEDIFGAFLEDGKTLVAQIECLLKSCHYEGTLVPCMLVGGVATKPEYRRMGAVREIFNEVFENALNKGALISILYPFSISYYKQFGYDIIGNYININCSFSSFKNIERFSSATLLKDENKDDFLKIYTDITAKYNMMFEKSDFDGFSLEPYTSCKFTYFISNGKEKGFVSFYPNRATRTIEVSQIAYTEKQALLKLLGFLRAYDGNYDTVNFSKLPLFSEIPNVLDFENRTFTQKLFKDGAGRILDVRSFLESIPFPKGKGSFKIKICDQQIDINNGVFIVEFGNQKATVKKVSADDYDIAMDISQFSKIVLGREGLTLEEISYLPGVTVVNNNPAFEMAFPRRKTQFFDDF